MEAITTCINCGKEFTFNKSRNGYTPKYCSQECRKVSYEHRNIRRHNLDEYIGQQFGEWTIIGGEFKNKRAYVLARCSCGVEKELILNNVLRGKTTSCGHWRKPNVKRKSSFDHPRFKPSRAIDERGHVYGELTVVREVPKEEQTEQQRKTKNIYWECLCSCGNKVITSGSRLRFGTVRSCGCVRSHGERVIGKILLENNIPYCKEVSFADLVDKNRLRFDFGVYNNSGELLYLIECDGIQHYKEKSFGSKEKQLPTIQKHDQLKNQYCLLHNIPLIRIPYFHINKLTLEDLTL